MYLNKKYLEHLYQKNRLIGRFFDVLAFDDTVFDITAFDVSAKVDDRRFAKMILKP